MAKEVSKSNINQKKALFIIMVMIYVMSTTSPLTLPLTAMTADFTKTQRLNTGELLATSFNRSGEIIGSFFFATAYAETASGGIQDLFGSVANTSISNNGSQNIYSNIVATKDIINSSGTITNSTVNPGGLINIQPGSVVSVTSTVGGGTSWSVTGSVIGPAEIEHAASDSVVSNLSLWRSENNNLTKRMGELRNSTGQAGEWVRIYKGDTTIANLNNRTTSQQYTAIQGGYDTKHSFQENGVWYTGFTLGYFDADLSFARGGGNSSSFTVGAYGSWLGNKGHFLDLILKQGRLKTSYYSYQNDINNTKLNGDYDDWGTSMSVEYGYRKQLAKSWYLEPQLEINYGRISSADYTTSNGNTVHNQGLNSNVGRLGLAIGKNQGQNTFYAKASIARDFSAKPKITMSSSSQSPITVEQNLNDTWLEFALGLTTNLSSNTKNGNTSGYLEISKTDHAKIKTDWLVNAGVRRSF